MNELANNITVQYSTIAQGQNYPQADAEAAGIDYTGHALGSLFQAGSNAKISVLHNLYAHLKGRLPRVGTEATALTVAGVGAYNDFRNNVFYNWLGTAGTGAGGQPSQNNFVGNFYLAGPGGDNPSAAPAPHHDVGGRHVDLQRQRRDEHQGLPLGQPEGHQQGRRRERRRRAGQQRLRIVQLPGRRRTRRRRTTA